MSLATKEKLTIFNVRDIEDEWALIQESEKLGGEMSLEESYKLNMKKLENLKIK